MPKLIYVIGVPGAGKTTLVQAAMGQGTQLGGKGVVPRVEYDDGWIQLGRVRPGSFSGTDALSLAIMESAVDFMAVNRKNVIAEGDRLANHRFFRQAKTWYFPMRVVLLEIDEEVAEARRAARVGAGALQDEAWVKGQETKIHNLRMWVNAEIDGSAPLAEQVAVLRDLMESPV